MPMPHVTASAGQGGDAAGAGGVASTATAGKSGDAAAGKAGAPTATAAGSGGATAPGLVDDFPSADSFPPLDPSQFGTPTVISSDLKLAEGPVWDPCGKRLLFSDVNDRKIHSFVPGGEIGTYLDDTNYTNALVFDPFGYLLMAEMGGGNGGRITRLSPDKQVEVLVDKNPDGGKLRTTDDLTLRSDGTIYFTDPIISHGPYLNDLGSLGTHAIYRLKPGAPGARDVVKEGQGLLPNGIRLSRDEKTLYVATYQGGEVLQFAVADDGSLTRMDNLATGFDSTDSMCLDIAGNLYVGVRGGLQVLSPDGTKVHLIPVTANARTTNCGFGGPDGKTLFITAWSALLQLDNAPVPGLDWYKNQKLKCN